LKEEKSEGYKIHELRGLYVLGVIAVLATIRFSVGENQIVMYIFGISVNLLTYIDPILVFWSFYAIMMVFGLSKDIIGDPVSKAIIEGSRTILALSLYLLAGLFVITIFGIFWNHLIFWCILFLLFLLFTPAIYKKIRSTKIPRYITVARETILKNAYALIITLLVILLFSDYKLEPIWIIGITVVGTIFFALYLYTRKKLSEGS